MNAHTAEINQKHCLLIDVCYLLFCMHCFTFKTNSLQITSKGERKKEEKREKEIYFLCKCHHVDKWYSSTDTRQWSQLLNLPY